MGEAFFWGLVGGIALLLGALLSFRPFVTQRMLGLALGFGAGVLISAVSFDLVGEAADMSSGQGAIVFGLFAGCGVFFGGDLLIDRLGGSERKHAEGAGAGGSSLAIVFGTVLDGIPESMVIGLTIYEGGAVGVAFLVAVFVSNLPEAISSTSGLVSSGWKQARILWMWIAIAVVSALSSLAGYVLFQDTSQDTVAFVLAFAAGAILTMLADTMMPEAFEHGGKLAGIVTTLGFAVAFAIHSVQ